MNKSVHVFNMQYVSCRSVRGSWRVWAFPYSPLESEWWMTSVSWSTLTLTLPSMSCSSTTWRYRTHTHTHAYSPVLFTVPCTHVLQQCDHLSSVSRNTRVWAQQSRRTSSCAGWPSKRSTASLTSPRATAWCSLPTAMLGVYSTSIATPNTRW